MSDRRSLVSLVRSLRSLRDTGPHDADDADDDNKNNQWLDMCTRQARTSLNYQDEARALFVRSPELTTHYPTFIGVAYRTMTCKVDGYGNPDLLDLCWGGYLHATDKTADA